MAVLRAPAGKSATRPEHTDGHRRALVLTARKPAVGHTEPAAGAVGLVYALAAVEQMHQQPLLHLTEVCGVLVHQHEIFLLTICENLARLTNILPGCR